MFQFKLPVNKNIVIVNKDSFWKKLIAMKLDGGNSLQERYCVISDFDYTLSTFYHEGTERNPSCHGIMEKYSKFSEEYRQEIKNLQNTYYPIEIDPTIPADVKAGKMKEWWSKAHELLIGTGMHRSDIVAAVAECDVRIREGAVELIEYCRDNKVPCLLFSAGLGDVLSEVLTQKCKISFGKEYSIEIIANMMKFDENDKLIDFEGECINSSNKNMSQRSYVNRQRNRDNVIVIGDNQGDIHMSDGVAFKNQISIGLLNDKIEERLPLYKELFDVVILNDSSLRFAVDVVKYIVEEVLYPCVAEEEEEGDEYIIVPPSIG